MIASRHDIAARGSGQRRAMVKGLSLLLCIAAWAACAGAGAGDWRGEYEALWRRPELENNR